MAWEVEAALRKMKNGKEAGKDQVQFNSIALFQTQQYSMHTSST